MRLLVLGAYVVAVVAMWSWLVRRRVRQYRRYRDHPEDRPTGRDQAVRGAPFVLLGVVIALQGVIASDWRQLLVGLAVTGLLSLSLWRRVRDR